MSDMTVVKDSSLSQLSPEFNGSLSKRLRQNFLQIEIPLQSASPPPDFGAPRCPDRSTFEIKKLERKSRAEGFLIAAQMAESSSSFQEINNNTEIPTKVTNAHDDFNGGVSKESWQEEEEIVAHLCSCGFAKTKAQLAARDAEGDQNHAERLMWKKTSSTDVKDFIVSHLISCGFSKTKARRASEKANGDLDLALNLVWRV